MLRKAAIIIINCICLSFFMFPVRLFFLPEQVNTKMIVALGGIIAFAIECVRGRSISFSKTLLVSATLAAVFSIWCFFSATVNGTDDTSYSRYWLSFATWLGGAYGVCWLIRETEGKLDLGKLTFYLALVCLLQSIFAIAIDNDPAFQRTIDRIFIQGQDFYHRIDRLYGIGAALDVGGVRFSVVLILMAHQMSAFGKALDSPALTVFYFVSFAVILIIGSIIARTTWAGAAIGLAYMGLSYLKMDKGVISSRQTYFWFALIGIIITTTAISAWMYNTNADFRYNLRFGFEGFFNWMESGTFRTDSTDKLNGKMWIWPSDPRTWAIGTGIFGDFAFGTDIGYCRFTLYCGLIGLSLFSIFFIYNGLALIRLFPDSVYMALLLIALTFIVWLKVATDIFFIYALLMCTASLGDKPSAYQAT
jgi:hypothetical protein